MPTEYKDIGLERGIAWFHLMQFLKSLGASFKYFFANRLFTMVLWFRAAAAVFERHSPRVYNFASYHRAMFVAHRGAIAGRFCLFLLGGLAVGQLPMLIVMQKGFI